MLHQVIDSAQYIVACLGLGFKPCFRQKKAAFLRAFKMTCQVALPASYLVLFVHN